MTYDLKAELAEAVRVLRRQHADALVGRVGDKSPRHADLVAFMNERLGSRSALTAAVTEAVIAEIAADAAKVKP